MYIYMYIVCMYTYTDEMRGLEFMGNVPIEVQPIIGAALCMYIRIENYAYIHTCR